MIWVKSLWMSDFNLKDCFLFTFSGCMFCYCAGGFFCYTLNPFVPHTRREGMIFFSQKSK